MTLQNQFVGFLLSLALLSLVLSQTRRRNLRPFFVVLWLGFSIFLMSVFLASSQLRWLSDRIFAFDDSRHFIYLISFGFLFVYAFYVTIVLNRLQDETRVLISELGILRYRLDQVSKRSEGAVPEPSSVGCEWPDIAWTS